MFTIRIAIMMTILIINLVKVETIDYNLSPYDPLGLTQPLSTYKFSSLTHPVFLLIPHSRGFSNREIIYMCIDGVVSKNSKTNDKKES